ncbi:MAG TPA: hypothetical protein VII06_11910 [Chloroflexota bacterium]
MDRALKPLGLSIDDVDQVANPFPEQPTALAKRSVDGAITVEPYGSRAVEVGPGRVLRYLNEDYPNHQVSFALISNRLIEHPDIAHAFAVGFLRGIRDYERARQFGEDVDGVIADIVKRNRVPPELLQALFRNGANTAMDPDGKLNVASLDYDLDWYRDHGAIQGELTTADYVDSQYAEYAARLDGVIRYLQTSTDGSASSLSIGEKGSARRLRVLGMVAKVAGRYDLARWAFEQVLSLMPPDVPEGHRPFYERAREELAKLPPSTT